MTITETTNNQPVEPEVISIFNYSHLALKCAEICGINPENGINYTCMNRETNFMPYAHLILHDEQEKNDASIKAKKEKMGKIPKTNRTPEEKEEYNTLKKEVDDLEKRIEAIKPVLAELNAVKPSVTPLAATWAYARGTSSFANGWSVQNYSKIVDISKDIHNLVKTHAEEVYAFSAGLDKNGNPISNESACHGEVYKKVKSKLSELFTLLYGQGIRANQGDVAWVVHACVTTIAGVNKADSNAKQAKFSIKRWDGCLREICKLLASKLHARETDGTTGAEKTDGTDKVMPISE